MRKELRRVQRFIIPTWALFALTVTFLVTAVQHSQSQTRRTAEDSIHISYQDRLSFYFDRESKRYLIDMAAKETLLLQAIRNISAEIKARGLKRVVADDPDFGPYYRDLDQLIVEYSSELDRVVDLTGEIERLRRRLDAGEKFAEADEAAVLQDSINALIEANRFDEFTPLSREELLQFLGGHYLDSELLESYHNELSAIERKLDQEKDRELLYRIDDQKNRVAKFARLAVAGGDSIYAGAAPVYAKNLPELNLVVDEMQFIRVESGGRLSGPSERADSDDEKNLEKRFEELFGVANVFEEDRESLSDIFKQWRSARQADYEAKLHAYLVMKASLLKHGAERERNRMLQRDLTDALLNYANEEYALCEMQLDQLLRDFGPYYKRLDGAHYYRGESRYAQFHYEQALEDFTNLIDNFPDNPFVEDAFLRTLTIAQTRNLKNVFSEKFAAFEKREAEFGDQVKNRVYFIAGYFGLKHRQNQLAERALKKISNDSKYHLPGQYLLGIVLSHRQNYDEAVTIFSKIGNMKNLPWSSAELALLRNNALLKLGFIHYERGQYDRALKYFEEISRGADGRDQALIGKAWASMKKGDFDASIANAEALFGGFVSSDYTYEALVLAAQCKRKINQSGDALTDLRYVSNAREALDRAGDYHAEREALQAELDEVERLEKLVFEQQRPELYKNVTEKKQTLQDSLIKMRYRSGVGEAWPDAQNQERQKLYSLLRDYDALIASAKEAGDRKVLKKAEKRRGKLIDRLVTEGLDESLKDSDYFVNYPLAMMESSRKQRKEVVRDMLREMELEKSKIHEYLNETQALLAKNPEASQFIDLRVVQDDLAALQDRIDRFQTWLNGRSGGEVESEFDQWTDFTGYGMSDITLENLNSREDQIAGYTQSIVSIEQILAKRRAEIEARLAAFEAESKRLAKEVEAEKLRLKKLEMEKNFKENYFDAKTTEVEKKK